MRIIGCDLHARQQTIAKLDSDTGELVEKTLEHEGEKAREFYAVLPGSVLVGIEASGSMHWFLKLLEELKIECRVGHPAKIPEAETRKPKHDRRDERLLLKVLAENRFPSIWMPSTEQRDLRTLLRHRHQWVRLRTQVQKGPTKTVGPPLTPLPDLQGSWCLVRGCGWVTNETKTRSKNSGQGRPR